MAGVCVLVATGFVLGLIFGVVSEEPELVAGHLAGRSQSIDWSASPERAPLADGELGAPYGVRTLGELPPVAAPREAARDEGVSAGAPPNPEGRAVTDVPVLGSRTAETTRPAPVADPLPARAAAPAKRKVAATAGGDFSIQVGAFAKSDSAEAMAAGLRGKGYPVLVVPTAGSANQRWRVRVGPLGTRAEAEAAERRLQSEERLPTWILAEGGG